jgi:hypothetical protein
MKYTYRIDLQGNARDIVYLKMLFDRNLAIGYHSSSSDKPIELVKAVNQVEGVTTCALGRIIDGGLITVEGNELVAKVNLVDMKLIPALVSRLVKRVQRRVAKGESRKRVKLTSLQQAVSKLNAKTYGVA